MKASVIMPLYNSEKYILEAVQSILNQTFTDFELIIIDDASADLSVDVISNIVDTRIKVVKLDNKMGIPTIMNTGIGLAKGEYVFRMDSDDVALPNRLERQIEYMDNHPECVVCGGWMKTTEGDVLKFDCDFENIKTDLLFFSPIANPTTVIRKGFLDENDIQHDEDFPQASDFDLWTRIAQIGEIHNIPEVLVLYRLHEGQVSNRFLGNQRSLSHKIVRRQITNFLGELNNKQELALNVLKQVLFNGPITREQQGLLKQFLARIVDINKQRQTFDTKALQSTIEKVKMMVIVKDN